jgi:hypothetical protein
MLLSPTQPTVETDRWKTMKKKRIPLRLQVGIVTAILQVIFGTTACHQNESIAGRGRIVRLDPVVDRIIPRTATIEKLAGGFRFTEGPVWHHDGYLLFSDLGGNQVYKWTPDGQVSAWQAIRGYAGEDPAGSFFLSLERAHTG